LGSINLHGSLLPDYRGAAPVQRALWDGRATTGVTTLWMDEGIDTGDVILQRWAAIEPADNAGTLAARLALLGAPLLAESLSLAHAGRAPRRAQERGAGSYARKISKREGRVDWALDSETVWNRQRAMTPWPGAAALFRGHPLLLMETRPLHRLPVEAHAGTVLAVTREGIDVACAPGALRVTRVKPESRAEMDAAEWAHGARVVAGDLLETEKEAHA
jgi:methionyl-tRNA formyltransferase